MVEKGKNEEKKSKWWVWVIIILIALYFYGEYRDRWEEENCDRTFQTHTYSDSCASACTMRCTFEGFTRVSSSYFEPYLSAEEMANPDLYKLCTCNCGGCRG